MTDQTAADLVRTYNSLDDWLAAESKRFADHCKPVREQMEAVKSKLHEMLLALGSKEKQSISTDHGTAYTSTIMTPKIVDRDKYLDFVLDNWDKVGNEMMQLSAPQKDAVRGFMEANAGQLPPGVEISNFIRVNIRRT